MQNYKNLKPKFAIGDSVYHLDQILHIRTFQWSYEDNCYIYFCTNSQHINLKCREEDLILATFNEKNCDENSDEFENDDEDITSEYNIESIKSILGNATISLHYDIDHILGEALGYYNDNGTVYFGIPSENIYLMAELTAIISVLPLYKLGLEYGLWDLDSNLLDNSLWLQSISSVLFHHLLLNAHPVYADQIIKTFHEHLHVYRVCLHYDNNYSRCRNMFLNLTCDYCETKKNTFIIKNLWGLIEKYFDEVENILIREIF